MQCWNFLWTKQACKEFQSCWLFQGMFEQIYKMCFTVIRKIFAILFHFHSLSLPTSTFYIRFIQGLLFLMMRMAGASWGQNPDLTRRMKGDHYSAWKKFWFVTRRRLSIPWRTSFQARLSQHMGHMISIPQQASNEHHSAWCGCGCREYWVSIIFPALWRRIPALLWTALGFTCVSLICLELIVHSVATKHKVEDSATDKVR